MIAVILFAMMIVVLLVIEEERIDLTKRTLYRRLLIYGSWFLRLGKCRCTTTKPCHRLYLLTR